MGDIGLREVRRRSEPPRHLAVRPAFPPGTPRRRGREAVRIAAAWILVIPTASWLGVRASGVGAGTWIETAIVLTPFVALGSVVVLAIVAALRVRPAVLAAAATCVGFGLVMAPLFASGPHPSYPPRGPALRVMTVNVQFGLADVDRVMRLVEDEDVDILGVQELTPGVRRGPAGRGPRGRAPLRRGGAGRRRERRGPLHPVPRAARRGRHHRAAQQPDRAGDRPRRAAAAGRGRPPDATGRRVRPRGMARHVPVAPAPR